jgi:hypothetical protein
VARKFLLDSVFFHERLQHFERFRLSKIDAEQQLRVQAVCIHEAHVLVIELEHDKDAIAAEILDGYAGVHGYVARVGLVERLVDRVLRRSENVHEVRDEPAVQELHLANLVFQK